MPIGFVGPALQGANFISRFGVPLLQRTGIAAGFAGLGALANTALTTPPSTPGRNRRANVGRNSEALNANKTDSGRELGSTLNNELRYINNQLQRGSLPYLDSTPLNGIQTGKYGPTDWNPNANPLASVTSNGAVDRAYQQELSRTAQMTAQDPELLRYETARAAAKTQEEMNSVRDMGLAMWQERYGKTDMGKPGGAIGSTNPVMRSTFGYQTGMSPGDVAKTITNPSVVPVSPGEAPYQMGDLGTRVTSETGYDPAAYGLSPELIKAYQEQLLKQAGSK